MANDASITDDLVPGTVWTEVEGQYDQVEVRFQEITPAAEESMVKKHQTIVDFVCQNAGEISGLFTTALLNGLSNFLLAKKENWGVNLLRLGLQAKIYK